MSAKGPSKSSSGRSNRWPLAFAILSGAGVFAASSNHFHNSFYFDDGTVIQNNAYLRSLRNIPLFFRNANTFSTYPFNAAYRPLTSASFAFDYWRGGGLDRFSFHVTRWTLRVALGVLIFFFLLRVLALAGLARGGRMLALFGASSSAFTGSTPRR